MPTLDQIRAARALLNWSQSDLADRTGLSQTGIARIESGVSQANLNTMDKIFHAFDEAGIEFIADRGVEKRAREVRQYTGGQGFRDFMDDVYETAKDVGGEICLYNAKPANWIKWLGVDWNKAHSERMATLTGAINFKITCKKGSYDFIGSKHAEYRWVPDKLWSEKAFYAYGDKIGFLNFEEDSVLIYVLKQRHFADSFRTLFNVAWEYATIIPDTSNYKPGG
jgi:transcriptional regulator with XRE-family HTH domain